MLNFITTKLDLSYTKEFIDSMISRAHYEEYKKKKEMITTNNKTTSQFLSNLCKVIKYLIEKKRKEQKRTKVW